MPKKAIFCHFLWKFFENFEIIPLIVSDGQDALDKGKSKRIMEHLMFSHQVFVRSSDVEFSFNITNVCHETLSRHAFGVLNLPQHYTWSGRKKNSLADVSILLSRFSLYSILSFSAVPPTKQNHKQFQEQLNWNSELNCSENQTYHNSNWYKWKLCSDQDTTKKAQTLLERQGREVFLNISAFQFFWYPTTICREGLLFPSPLPPISRFSRLLLFSAENLKEPKRTSKKVSLIKLLIFQEFNQKRIHFRYWLCKNYTFSQCFDDL